jgi:hypothetical protein
LSFSKDFHSHGCANWSSTETKVQEETELVIRTFDPPLLSNPMSSSFFIHFK